MERMNTGYPPWVHPLHLVHDEQVHPVHDEHDEYGIILQYIEE
jgi:hypothetical protein